MIRFFLSATAALAIAPAAFAQDVPASNWSGPYVGIHAGYGFDSGRKATDQGFTANNITALATGIRSYQLNQNRAGPIGGGQAGFNIQRDHLILGVEGDFSYMDSRGTSVYRGVGVPGTAAPGRRTLIRSDLDWMGSARARAGYALSDQGMAYVTGGYAFGRVKGRAEFDGDSDATVNYFGRHKYMAQGWIAGGGLEFRPFTQGMMSKISFGAEATYYDLGKSSIYALQTNTQAGYYRVGTTTRGYNGVLKMNYAF